MTPKRVKGDADSAAIPEPSPSSTRTGLMAILGAAALASVLLSSWPASTWMDLASRLPGLASSEGIRWQSCKDDSAFQCGMLSVPLNYLDRNNTRTVQLALRRYPAPVKRSERLGSLLINPGGPGGSGLVYALKAARSISAIVDGKYDIIGFDPRGVGATTPSFGCSTSSKQEVWTDWDFRNLPLPIEGRNGSIYPLDDVQDEERRIWSRMSHAAEAMVVGCETTGDVDMIRSASTAFAARDMRSILDALGEDNLNYWGISYGTVLGAHFAAMFPEKVGRLVLDGVVNSEAWTSDFRQWAEGSMVNGNDVRFAFAKNCAEQPETCLLAGPDSAASDILDQIAQLSARLATDVLPIPTSAYGSGILDAKMLYVQMVVAAYWPRRWPALARMIASALHGDGRELYEYFASARPAVSDEQPGGAPWPYLTTALIQCMDSVHPHFASLDEKILLARKLASNSPGGEMWAVWIMFRDVCSLEAYEAYRGPWSREDGLSKTAFPLLFIGNTADNVTPLASARKMVQNFGDSATLLFHDGFGHTSLAQPSLCTAKTIRSYFVEGTVPAAETVCAVQQSWPFVPIDYERLDNADRKLMEHLETMSGVFN